MGFFNAFVNLPVALGKKNRFSLDSVTCTTSDYLNFKVVFSRLYTPKSKWKIDASQFTRLTPLLKPAFANASFENRLFFVPYRTVMKDFTHLVDGTQNSAGVVPQSCKHIDFFAILYAFISLMSGETASSHALVVPFTNTDSDKSAIKNGGYDLVVPVFGSTNYAYFYKFTPLGKRIHDILISLGYNFPFYLPFEIIDPQNPNPTTFSVGGIQLGEDSTKVSANTLYCQIKSVAAASLGDYYDEELPTTLPLASALKVYYDYYLSGRGMRVQYGLFIESVINYLTENEVAASSGTIACWNNCLNLRAAFKFFGTLYYDDDYFNTSSPTYMDTFGTVGNGYVIPDASMPEIASTDKTRVVSGTSAATTTPHLERDANGSYNNAGITQYILDSLMALTKYMRRNNIVGWRSIDRYLAHYGVKLEPAVLNRSLYLGKFVSNVGIDAIFQQAETSEDILGSYAGIGVGGGKGHFEFESKEFGQLIMISVCKPDVAYYQGMKREMFDSKRFEFFAGEFDNLGQQAVSRFEVVNSTSYQQVKRNVNFGNVLPSNPNGVWGFQNRYAHLKQSTNQDILSGDFRCHSAGAAGYDYFHQFRSVGIGINIGTDGVVDDNFRSAKDSGQFDRIFANTSDMYDHFISFFSFKVECYAPWQPLFDSLDFGDELHNGQPTRNVKVGGTKF